MLCLILEDRVETGMSPQASKLDDDESQKHVVWKELGMIHLKMITKTGVIIICLQVFEGLVYEREIYLEHECKLQTDIFQVHIKKKNKTLFVT